jgi:chromosome segregation ATPase
VDAARTQPALGQLLIERGVLTPAQFERVLAVHKDNDKPLSDIIVEHGLAERHMIEAALADHSGSKESNVIAIDSAARAASGSADEEAEWRRRLFDLAGSSDATSAESSSQPPRPRGFKRKLARNLEAYLARTAAELDERGEILQRRTTALAEELERVSTAEAAVEKRARRLHELDLAGGELASRIDELLGLIGERDARLEALTSQHDDLGKRLELAQTGFAQAQAVVAEREDQLLSREERIAGLLQEVEALQTANEAQLENLAEARGSLAGALAECAQRDDQLRASELTRASIGEELERTSARLRTAEQNLAERDEMLAKLEAANAAQLDDLGELRGVLDERITRIAELEQELEQLASSHDQRVGELQARFEGEVQGKRQHEERLGQLSARLVERERHVSELQEKLGWRERELEGLRRETDERNAALAAELDALRATLQASGEGDGNSSVAQQDDPAPAHGGLRRETTYLCFVPIPGSYALVERSGPLPKPGDEIAGPEYGGRRFLVSQVTQSPLPLDQRMCAYLLALD